MNSSKKVSAPEIAELMNKVYVAFFFAVAIISGSNALEYLLINSGTDLHILVWVRRAILILAIVLLGVFVWKARQLKCSGQVFFGDEFVHLVFNKAVVISWFFTWMLLMFLSEFFEHTSLSLKFFLQLIVSLMMLVHSFSFFILYQRDNDSESGELL